jgi:hypothetical protein
MWLRNTETGPVNYDKWNRKLGFDTWMKDPQYADEVKILYENTTMNLARIDGADKGTVLKELKLSVDALLNRYENNHLPSAVGTVRIKLMGSVPKELRKMLNLARVTLTWKPIMKAAELMGKDGVNVDLKQLHEIVEFMEKNL